MLPFHPGQLLDEVASNPTSPGRRDCDPSTLWMGRLTNQRLGFHMSGLLENACP